MANENLKTTPEVGDIIQETKTKWKSTCRVLAVSSNGAVCVEDWDELMVLDPEEYVIL